MLSKVSQYCNDHKSDRSLWVSSKCLRLVVGQVLLITLIKRVKGGLTTDKSLTVVYMSVFQQWRVANE